MDTAGLVTLAQENVHRLNVLWDEIGTEPDNRNHQIQELAKEVAAVFTNRCLAEEATRDTWRIRISEAEDCVQHIATQLGESVEKIPGYDTMRPLTRKHGVITDHVCMWEKKKEERAKIVEASFETLRRLFEELGTSPIEQGEFRDFGEDLSHSRAKRLEEKILEVSVEKARRTDHIKAVSNEIRRLNVELNVQDSSLSTDYERAVFHGTEASLGVTCRVMEELDTLKDGLEREKHDREETIKAIAYKITQLWDRLKITEEERQTFFDCNMGLGPDVVKACETELARLVEMKRASMVTFIAEAREKLQSLLSSLHVSEAERTRLIPVESGIFTDEELERHESLIATLETRLTEMRPLLVLVERREAIMQEKADFEAYAADPSRLLARTRDPGRLLREEKFRKTIERELPRLNEKLKHKLAEFKRARGEDFLYDGIHYLQSIIEEEEEERVHKEEEKNRKKMERALRLEADRNADASSTPRRGLGTPHASQATSPRSNAPTPRFVTPSVLSQHKGAPSRRGGMQRENVSPVANIPIATAVHHKTPRTNLNSTAEFGASRLNRSTRDPLNSTM